MKSNKSEGRETRRAKDVFNIENWVGADVWHQMVQKAMRGLKYISDHKDEPRIWCKKVHNLANLFLSVIVFLTTHPGRCGGWKVILVERCG